MQRSNVKRHCLHFVNIDANYHDTIISGQCQSTVHCVQLKFAKPLLLLSTTLTSSPHLTMSISALS